MLFAITAAVSVGLVPSDLGGIVNMTQPIFTFGSGDGAVTITLAKGISLAVLGAIFYFNRQDMSNMTVVEYWTVVATGALVVSPVFLPIVESILTDNTLAGLVSLAVQTSGVLVLSYAG